MKTVELGRTKMRVSEVGFGGIPISRLTLKEAVELVRHCFDLGLTLFDTANMYGDSESKLGQALKPVRDQVVLATKTLARDPETAVQHLKQSLKSLATDWIDLYQVHNISDQEDLDRVLAPGGVYEVLDRARDQGRIRFIGFSSHSPETALRAVRTGLFETLQFRFNFIEDGPLKELFPAAQEMGLGLIGMKPLGGGLLERADLCFKYLQAHSEVVPIPGLETKAEAEEIVGFYQSPQPLSEADQRAIEAIRDRLGSSFCRRCGYCQPCPEGIEIPMVLIFKSSSRRLSPNWVISTSQERMAKVENCQDCGQCQEKCPYDLPIPDLLKEMLGCYREFCQKHSAEAPAT